MLGRLILKRCWEEDIPGDRTLKLSKNVTTDLLEFSPGVDAFVSHKALQSIFGEGGSGLIVAVEIFLQLIHFLRKKDSLLLQKVIISDSTSHQRAEER